LDSLPPWDALSRKGLGGRATDRASPWPLSLAALALTLLLGGVHVMTDAKFAFASLGVLAVMLVAWIAGGKAGMLVAVVAAAVWIVGDITAGTDGGPGWIPWANGVTRLLTYAAVCVLTVKVAEGFERERVRAMSDDLTRLHNRRTILERGDSEVVRANRDKHSLAIVFIDLDDFKQFNDRHGHRAGDAALEVTAQVLRVAARSSDVVGRIGGDEFVVVLPQIERGEAVEAAHRMAGALRAALAPFEGVSASAGVAWFERPDRPFSAMLHAADGLMYRAKQSGKGGVVVADMAEAANAGDAAAA